MADQHIIGISDLKAGRSPDTLITFALGSCVGIALYDRITCIGGLAHIMLPDSSLLRADVNQKKFANTALPLMLRQMEAMGARRYFITAKIAGGAMLFGQKDALRIGERNIAAVKNQLVRLGISLTAEDTGLNYGRTMRIDLTDGSVTIKTALHGTQLL